jgi:hypothetical protein
LDLKYSTVYVTLKNLKTYLEWRARYEGESGWAGGGAEWSPKRAAVLGEELGIL